MSVRILWVLTLSLILLTGCGGDGGGGSDDGTQTGVRPIKFNDTGIDWFADNSNNFLPDAPVDFVAQDASYGRDAQASAGTLVKTGGGKAGFDFTKLDAAGLPLPDQGVDYADTPWACVSDNVTGLIWEVKSDDGGLRNKENTYSWYNEDATSNGGHAGTSDGGTCTGGIACDTAAYIAAINASGLCGDTGWRLPTQEELRSIVDYGVASPDPTIDIEYFPNASDSWYWSASPYANSPNHAWYIDFRNGPDNAIIKSFNLRVRLVLGGQ